MNQTTQQKPYPDCLEVPELTRDSTESDLSLHSISESECEPESESESDSECDCRFECNHDSSMFERLCDVETQVEILQAQQSNVYDEHAKLERCVRKLGLVVLALRRDVDELKERPKLKAV